MYSQKYLPERIISGFFHLTWLILMVFVLLDVKPCEIAEYLKVLSGSAAALIASIIIGAAYFLGCLFDQTITDFVRIIAKVKKIEPKSILSLTHLRKNNLDAIIDLQNKYIGKSFFRSIGFGGTAILFFSFLWWNNSNGSANIFWVILIIGLLIEISSWRNYLALRKDYSDLYDKVKK
jgi:hypothetical protein